MKVQWQKLWFKTILWLGAEILLTLMGLDDLADYSEFLYQQKQVASMEKAYLIRQVGGAEEVEGGRGEGERGSVGSVGSVGRQGDKGTGGQGR